MGWVVFVWWVCFCVVGFGWGDLVGWLGFVWVGWLEIDEWVGWVGCVFWMNVLVVWVDLCVFWGVGFDGGWGVCLWF